MILKNNCTSGELTPKMHHRSGLEQHKNGLVTCLNGIVSPYGGVERRNGTRYISTAKYANRMCIVRKFVFSEDQAYTLEIGHLYIRFYTSKAQIVHTVDTVNDYSSAVTYDHEDYVKEGTTIYRSKEDSNLNHLPSTSPAYWSQTNIIEVTTIFEESHLRNLRFEQSADVLYIFHGTRTAKLTRKAHTIWEFSTDVFTGGAFKDKNDTIVELASSATTGDGVTITATNYTPVTSGDLMPGSNCVSPDSDANSLSGLTPYVGDGSTDDYSVSSVTGGVTGYAMEIDVDKEEVNTDNTNNVYDCVSDGTYVYYLDRNTSKIHATSYNPSTGSFTHIDDATTQSSAVPYSIAIGGSNIYIGTESAIERYTFNGTTLSYQGYISSSDKVYTIFANSSYVFAGTKPDVIGTGGDIKVYDSTLSIIDTYSTRGSNQLYYDGTYLYSAASTGYSLLQAFSFDGSNLTHITDKSSSEGIIYGVVKIGTYIYTLAAWSSMGSRNIRAFTFDGSDFTLIDTNTTIDEAMGIYEVAGMVGLIADSSTQAWLDLWTVENSTLVRKRHINTGLAGNSAQFSCFSDGNIVYWGYYTLGICALHLNEMYSDDQNTDAGVSLTITGLTVGELYTLQGSFKLTTYDGDTNWQAKAFLETDGSKTEYTLTTSWQTENISFSASSTSAVVKFGLNVSLLSTETLAPNVKILWDNITLVNESTVFYPGHINSVWQLTPGLSTARVTQTFSGTGTTSKVSTASEKVAIEIDRGSWVATFVVERSFNKGTDWYGYMTITAGGIWELSDNRDIDYRVNCTSYTSGSPKVQITKLSQDSEGEGTFIVTAVASDGLSCTANIRKELTSTDATMDWSEAEWNSIDGYPLAGKIYEGRMMLTGTYNNPAGIWGSSTLNFNDMTVGTDDADGLAFSLDARGGLNQPQWMAAWDKLLVGTTGGEIRLSSEGITPSNPPDKKQDTNYGSANIQAFMAARALLFIDKSQRTLREYIYDDKTNSYDAASLSVIGDHILKNGAIDAAFQQKPNAIVWCVLNNGTLGCLTYMPLHSVAGWHRHSTNGYFESVCVLPGTNGDDEVWFSVKREIGGSIVRYIEVLEEETADYNQLVYADSALLYSGSAITEVTGLDHLNGMAVKVLADGSKFDHNVSENKITLDTAASEIVVGLKYTTTIKTLEPDRFDDTTYGQIKDIFKATVNFVDTGDGVQIGLDSDHMLDIPELTAGELNTIEAPVLMDGGNGKGTIIIETDSPTPMYVSAIVYDIESGDE